MGLLVVSFLWTTGMLFTERLHAEQSVKLAKPHCLDCHRHQQRLSCLFRRVDLSIRNVDAGIEPFDGTQSLVLTALNAAGWMPHAEDGWNSSNRGMQRRVHATVLIGRSIGWYADTLGAYPVWMSGAAEPIERVELWKRQ